MADVPWPNAKEAYELLDVIGSGATSIVQAAYCSVKDSKCAVKRIDLEKCNTTVEELSKEIQAMSQCKHENVVAYFTSFVVKHELWLIMQLCSGGSLLDILKSRLKTHNGCPQGVLDEVVIATVLKEVLKGLDYFHSNGQIHRDIKAGNILVTEEGNILLADFGVSAWLTTGKGGGFGREGARHTFVGTPCWMAPEVMEQVKGYDFKADIWSLGITAIELATGSAPYHKFPPMKVLVLTMQNEPPSFDTAAREKDQYKSYGKSLRKFVSDCLKKEAEKRPTAKELLKYELFKKTKDKESLAKALLSEGVQKLQKTRSNRRVGVMPHVLSQPVKRVPGSSGRLHKTQDGEWEWSDDELDINSAEGMSAVSSDRSPRVKDAPVTVSSTMMTPGTTTNLVLRLRNEKMELNDIKFEFTAGQDTADSVSNELVEAGLIEGADRIVVAANLTKILESSPPSNAVTFKLHSNLGPNQIPDEKTLMGYGQLTLA